jgi:hypothetical protein
MSTEETLKRLKDGKRIQRVSLTLKPGSRKHINVLLLRKPWVRQKSFTELDDSVDRQMMAADLMQLPSKPASVA